jgi:hypothetical protein
MFKQAAEQREGEDGRARGPAISAHRCDAENRGEKEDGQRHQPPREEDLEGHVVRLCDDEADLRTDQRDDEGATPVAPPNDRPLEKDRPDCSPDVGAVGEG